MARKVLIITYYWPPSGGAGVQRWVKFAKYLPECGWEPVILTIDPEYAAYPVIDKSLASELPGSIKVFKTKARDYFAVYKKDRSNIPSAGFASNQDNSFKGKFFRFIRGNFFIPDPRRGWNKFAVEKASELIVSNDIINVITTSPPHSTQMIGLKLKKSFPHINWIADLRDPWTDIYYYDQFFPTFISKWIDGRFEKSVLKKSDKIITVGNSLKELFQLKIQEAEKKIRVITNGYDPEDFRNIIPGNTSTFTITYVGTLSDIYPIDGLLSALNNIRNSGNNFILRFIGVVSPNQKKLLESQLRETELQILSYADHSESIKHMCSSSALLMLIPDHFSNKSIITGKIFEYLAAGRPVICLGPPDGDASAILSETGRGHALMYSDITGIDKLISSYIHYKDPVMRDITRFSRIELTRRLANLLQETL